jgi:predicted nucleotidyltransferase
VSAIADGATIELAGRALIEATEGPARVILFGSRARGDGDDRSDFDFLVIKRDVDDRFGEMARLGRILGRLLIPADVVVVSEQHARKWESVKGTMIHEAMSEGRIIAES